MKKIRGLYFILIVVLVGSASISCSKKPEQTFLYNVDSLVAAQVNFLSNAQARLHKQAIINGAADDTILTDTSVWKNELAIFRELHGVNKAVNRSNYLVDDGLFDPSSNLTVKAFSAKVDLPVKYIRVFYHDSVQKPRKIEALYDNKNPLYKSGRLLIMEFENLQSHVVLTSYTIEGGQKMMMGDTVTFSVHGRIMIN